MFFFVSFSRASWCVVWFWTVYREFVLLWLLNLQGDWKGKKIVFDRNWNYSPSSSVAYEIYRVHVWLGVVCAMNVVFLLRLFLFVFCIVFFWTRCTTRIFLNRNFFYILSTHWPKNTSLSHRFIFSSLRRSALIEITFWILCQRNKTKIEEKKITL